MSGTKLLIAMCLGLGLVACAQRTPSQSTVGTSNPELREELMFIDSDGCKVKRFVDARSRYYVVCPRGVEVAPTEWLESCGKNCVTAVGISGDSL